MVRLRSGPLTGAMSWSGAALVAGTVTTGLMAGLCRTPEGLRPLLRASAVLAVEAA